MIQSLSVVRNFVNFSLYFINCFNPVDFEKNPTNSNGKVAISSWKF